VSRWLAALLVVSGLVCGYWAGRGSSPGLVLGTGAGLAIVVVLAAGVRRGPQPEERAARARVALVRFAVVYAVVVAGAAVLLLLGEVEEPWLLLAFVLLPGVTMALFSLALLRRKTG
jgi:hypothetical protein